MSQGTGTATANVRDVQVRCENLAAATFTVGGSVTGLSGTGLVLQNNGRDDLAVGATAASPLPRRRPCTARPMPSLCAPSPCGQSCTVANGTGTVASGHVTAVEVRCATAAAGLPEGEWKQELCVQARPGTWGRNVWRITRQSETRQPL